MNPVSARLLAQQLICPQFTSPHDVVEWIGAVQGQEYRLMRWAVAMRTRKPSAAAFEREYNEGRIVRGHLFRTTWQLVAGEDWCWMLELCRTNALRGLAGWMKSNGVIIPRAEQDRVQQIFSDWLESRGESSGGRGPASAAGAAGGGGVAVSAAGAAGWATARKADFAAAVAERGLAMDDQRLSYHIRLAEYSGLLCSGDLLPLKPSYALVSAKLPGRRSLPREEALALLALKYFRSHGPATLEDFVWWSGLGVGDCRIGLEAIREDLVSDRWKGLTFWRHRDSRTRGMRSGTVTLLPSYDEYLIGYKSRHVALDPDLSHRAHNNTGNFWPVLLLDGQVIGNWSLPAGNTGGSNSSPDSSPGSCPGSSSSSSSGSSSSPFSNPGRGGQPRIDLFDPGITCGDEALSREIARYQKFLTAR